MGDVALDFDPLQVPAGLSVWFARATVAERERAVAAFARRALAARHVLRAVAELRLALAKCDDPVVETAVPELLERARGLHDYDPTSD